jgi:D-alanyl-D-alanine carboxypeptidase
MSRKKFIIITFIFVAVIVIVLGSWLFIKSKQNKTSKNTTNAVVDNTKTDITTPANQNPAVTPQPTPSPTPTPVPPTVSQWPVHLTAAEATAITVDVNKKHKLPDTYVPAGLTYYAGVQLRSETVAALTDLVNAAAANGYNLKLISGYRSFASQTTVYNNYVAQDGQAAADTYSARPGYSEHQTGLAADVGNGTCDLETCFGDTTAGKWIAINAQNYGFIIRYPQGKEADTGYQYEPWHLRFVGGDTARAIYNSGKTLDQYYGIAAGGYE